MRKTQRSNKYLRKTYKRIHGGNKLSSIDDWKNLVKMNKSLPPLSRSVLDIIGTKKIKEYYTDYIKNPSSEPTDKDRYDVLSLIITNSLKVTENIKFLIEIAYIPTNSYGINIIELFMSRTKFSDKASQDIFEEMVKAGLNVQKENTYNPLYRALQNKRYDIAEILIKYGADTSEIPQELLDSLIPFNTVLLEKQRLEKQQREYNASRKQQYIQERKNMNAKDMRVNRLSPVSRKELRALLTYETQPERGILPGNNISIDNRIATIIDRQPPLDKELLVWRGHYQQSSSRRINSINPASWFSTTLKQEITEHYKNATCCLFKIHIQPGIKILNLYDIYKTYGVLNPYYEQKNLGIVRYRNYSEYQEIIVEGGGEFYKDVYKTEKGFTEIEPGMFETFYFPTMKK